MDKSKFSIQSLPEIIVASHREIIPNYAALGPLCVEKIGPEMQRLGCKCPAPGYCFTIEHNKEYRPTDIDIELLLSGKTQNSIKSQSELLYNQGFGLFHDKSKPP